MDENSLNRSTNRNSKKRNSHDMMRNSMNSCKNNKKRPLPEICIDLNKKNIKPTLTLESKYISKIKNHAEINIVSNAISSCNETKRFMKPSMQYHSKHEKQYHSKPDVQSIKIIYNTENLRKNNHPQQQRQNHPQQSRQNQKYKENQNQNYFLSQYRDQIQMLRIENQQLREQNQKFQNQQQSTNNQIKQLKQENLEYFEQNKKQLYILQQKSQKYRQKIKQLYELLIEEKKKDKKVTQGSHQNNVFDDRNSSPIYSTHFIAQNNDIHKNRNRTKGQLYSHRNSKMHQLRENDQNYQNQPTSVRYQHQKMSSPSSLSQMNKNTINFWNESQNEYRYDHLQIKERQGSEAYYQTQKQRKQRSEFQEEFLQVKQKEKLEGENRR